MLRPREQKSIRFGYKSDSVGFEKAQEIDSDTATKNNLQDVGVEMLNTSANRISA